MGRRVPIVRSSEFLVNSKTKEITRDLEEAGGKAKHVREAEDPRLVGVLPFPQQDWGWGDVTWGQAATLEF